MAGALERRRLRIMDAEPAPSPHAAIARALVVSEAVVGKHIGNILTKLDLPPDEDAHRRVLAVVAFLRG